MKRLLFTLISVMLIIPAGELSAGRRCKRQKPLTTRVYMMPGKRPKAAERNRSDADSIAISTMTDNERFNELIRELYMEKGIAPPVQTDKRENRDNGEEQHELVHFGKKVMRFVSGLLNKKTIMYNQKHQYNYEDIFQNNRFRL